MTGQMTVRGINEKQARAIAAERGIKVGRREKIDGQTRVRVGSFGDYVWHERGGAACWRFGDQRIGYISDAILHAVERLADERDAAEDGDAACERSETPAFSCLECPTIVHPGVGRAHTDTCPKMQAAAARNLAWALSRIVEWYDLEGKLTESHLAQAREALEAAKTAGVA